MLAIKKIPYLFFATIIIVACTKEPVTQQTIEDGKTSTIYGVNDVDVTQKGINKINQKSITEYASIAYSDVYQKTISQTEFRTNVKYNIITLQSCSILVSFNNIYCSTRTYRRLNY